MKKEKFSIVAVDQNNGIGKDNKLPWHLDSEIKYFKEKTLHTDDPQKRNSVIMGRKTWESIPEKNRPLKNRLNIILTTSKDYKAPGATICNSIENAIAIAEDDESVEKIFFIGGAKVFEESLSFLDGIYITQIKQTFDCDTFFPEIPEYFENIKLLGSAKENNIEFDYLLYRNLDND